MVWKTMTNWRSEEEGEASSRASKSFEQRRAPWAGRGQTRIVYNPNRTSCGHFFRSSTWLTRHDRRASVYFLHTSVDYEAWRGRWRPPGCENYFRVKKRRDTVEGTAGKRNKDRAELPLASSARSRRRGNIFWDLPEMEPWFLLLYSISIILWLAFRFQLEAQAVSRQQGLCVFAATPPIPATFAEQEREQLPEVQRAALCELKKAIWEKNPEYLFYTQKAFPAAEQADLSRRPYELFRLLPIDVPPELVPHRQRTCAVVGSSGVLAKHQLGKHIDAHDVVLRVNGAPAGNRDHSQHLSARPVATSAAARRSTEKPLSKDVELGPLEDSSTQDAGEVYSEQLASIAGTRTDIRLVNGWHISEAKPYVYGVESTKIVDWPRKEVHGEEILHWRNRDTVGDILVGVLPTSVYKNGFYEGADFTKFSYWMKYLGIRRKDMRDYEFASALGHVRTDRTDGQGTGGPTDTFWESMLHLDKFSSTRQHLLIQARKLLERDGRAEMKKSHVYRKLQRLRKKLRQNLSTWIALAKERRTMLIAQNRLNDTWSEEALVGPWLDLDNIEEFERERIDEETAAAGRLLKDENEAEQDDTDQLVDHIHTLSLPRDNRHGINNVDVTSARDSTSSKIKATEAVDPLAVEYAREYTDLQPDSLPYYLLTPNLLTGLQKFLNDFKPSGPSTGALGIGLALHLCNTVDLYGFESGVDGMQEPTEVKAHYWDEGMDPQRRTEMQQAHPILSEEKRWQQLRIPHPDNLPGLMRIPGLGRLDAASEDCAKV
ncbi:unnamed protein product [Amoebophrya sp. A120]|nr:unnamed protein product [Amoebophrya sp. A120]|eukprot:GSA120T00015174001.1